LGETKNVITFGNVDNESNGWISDVTIIYISAIVSNQPFVFTADAEAN
jgi:hypothetical protein